MKKSIRLELTPEEKSLLRHQKVRVKDLGNYSADEIATMLQADDKRAKEIQALFEFQSIPSLGYGFATELISQGYYSLEQLKDKDPVALFEAYEKHCGAWADSCVEDSYRLLTHFIKHGDTSKRWWDFTSERKAYRAKFGFKAERPEKPWYELVKFKKVESDKIMA